MRACKPFQNSASRNRQGFNTIFTQTLNTHETFEHRYRVCNMMQYPNVLLLLRTLRYSSILFPPKIYCTIMEKKGTARHPLKKSAKSIWGDKEASFIRRKIVKLGRDQPFAASRNSRTKKWTSTWKSSLPPDPRPTSIITSVVYLAQAGVWITSNKRTLLAILAVTKIGSAIGWPRLVHDSICNGCKRSRDEGQREYPEQSKSRRRRPWNFSRWRRRGRSERRRRSGEKRSLIMAVVSVSGFNLLPFQQTFVASKFFVLSPSLAAYNRIIHPIRRPRTRLTLKHAWQFSNRWPMGRRVANRLRIRLLVDTRRRGTTIFRKLFREIAKRSVLIFFLVGWTRRDVSTSVKRDSKGWA